MLFRSEARVQLAQFGPADLKAVAMTWRLVGADRAIIAQGTLPSRDLPTGDLHDLGSIQTPLDRINAPARLRLEVGAAGHSFANHWDLFVYPAKTDAQPPANVLVTNTLDDAARQKLAQGGRVLLLANPQLIKPDPVHGQVKLGFSPIFWNTAWTQWQPPHTLGILCDPAHPALAAFPTESHSNWQWWDVVNGGKIGRASCRVRV